MHTILCISYNNTDLTAHFDRLNSAYAFRAKEKYQSRRGKCKKHAVNDRMAERERKRAHVIENEEALRDQRCKICKGAGIRLAFF